MDIPKHLSDESKEIWKKLDLSFLLEASHRILLKVALESYDRYQGARQAIDAAGMTYKVGNLIKENPACKVEKEARSGFLQAWRLLQFDVDPPGGIHANG